MRAVKPAAPGAVHAPLIADRQDVSMIVPLESQRPDAIEHLLDDAFGVDRHARTAYLIRGTVAWIPALSFAVVDGQGALIGSLQSWPIVLTQDDGTQCPYIMVGPVAVAPAHQGGGHGRAMMDAVVAAAKAQGTAPLMMIGDPEYYGRFWGFSAEGTGGWRAPGPVEQRRLLALSVDGRAVGGVGMLGPDISVIA